MTKIDQTFKKSILLLVVLLSLTVTVSAEEDPCADLKKPKKVSSFDYHIGGGYSAIILEEGANFPLGFSAYAGVGYRFNRVFSIGAEYEFEYAKTFDSRTEDAHAIGNLPKAYLKFRLADIFAVTTTLGAGLYKYEDKVPDADDISIDYNSFMLGLRATVFIVYAQVNLTSDLIQLGAGVAFSM